MKNNELFLFDISKYDATENIKRLKIWVETEPSFGFIRGSWHPIKLDNVDRLARISGVSRQMVLNIYEMVTNERLSNNSEN